MLTLALDSRSSNLGFNFLDSNNSMRGGPFAQQFEPWEVKKGLALSNDGRFVLRFACRSQADPDHWLRHRATLHRFTALTSIPVVDHWAVLGRDKFGTKGLFIISRRLEAVPWSLALNGSPQPIAERRRRLALARKICRALSVPEIGG